MELIPLREGLPRWFDQPWVRNRLLSYFGVEAPFSRGKSLQILDFTCRDGSEASVAAPICYESFLPWLPHYRNSERADAIVHLVYDGHFADHPQCVARQEWACRYRAIETRKWNLVCTTWAGSALVNPAGEVVAHLDSSPGVLRTDRLESLGYTVSE